MPFRVVSDKGTNHGSHWIYDTHVPLMWLGPMVKPGNYAGTASPADIAPTLMTMLGIEQFPRFSGRVLHEILTSPTAQSPE
jgi:phosphoglycerol transferase MdoB-like AlkP superfamily enzyme